MRQKTGPKPRPLAERFFEKVEKMPSGCWHWTGQLSTTGYGAISVQVGLPGERRGKNLWAYPRNGKWVALRVVNGKQTYFGTYATQTEAYEASLKGGTQ